MPKFIVKIADHYLEWSTVVDAPVTYGMTMRQFRAFYRSEYGRSEMGGLDARLARADATGTSSIVPRHESVRDAVSHNRAGKSGTCLTIKQIENHYVRRVGKTLPRGHVCPENGRCRKCWPEKT